MARWLTLLVLSSVTAACGGGGGGGGGGSGGGGGGGAAAFALTESNALEAAEYALSSAEEAFGAALITVNVGLELQSSGTKQKTLSCGPGSATLVELSYEDRDGTGTPTAGDVIRFQHGECGGSSRNLSLALSVFDRASLRFEGLISFDSALDPPGSRFVGELAIAVTTDAAGTHWRMSNVSLTQTVRGAQQSVRIASAELLARPAGYQFSAAGGSVDSPRLGGSYTFATSAPLTGVLGRLPVTGSVELSTAEGSRVSIRPPASPTLGEATVDYAVAARGAAFGAPRQALWTAMLSGDLFAWEPNRAPVISGLRIDPGNPLPGAPLFATYDASDPNDGDTLTIHSSWKRNGATVATDTRSVTLPTVRNDVVEFTVSVTDDRGLTTTSTVSVTIGNRAPVLTSFSITPESPDTTADLVAVANVSDPDGDPLQATYVWRRDGTVLPGRTTATLPASETTRGDSIAVEATFSDGTLAATATAHTTIVDALPRVSVAQPPVSAVYGRPTTFTATASDPDGDPIGQWPFAVAYGPAGMTVHPVTGVVSWTPAGPMFDRTLDVSWGVTIERPGAHAATGTLRVEDPARQYPLLRTGIQIPVLGSLRIGDFDGDHHAEMLLLGPRSLLEIKADGTGGYRESWEYPFALDPADRPWAFSDAETMTAGDVDGDGRYEIFVTAGKRIFKLDGVERRVVASVAVGANEQCADLEYGDLDRDGAAELVCAAVNNFDPQHLIVYRASDLSVVTTLGPAEYGGTLALGNVDADAALEIVTSGGYVIDGKTTAVEWQRPQGFSLVAVGNVDGTGVDEIVAVDSGKVTAFRSGVATPLFGVASPPLDALFVGDFGGDARAEILAGDNQWGNVTAYRYDAGTGTAGIVFQIDSQSHGVSAFGVGDVDGDSRTEIVWGTDLSSSGSDKLVVAGLNPGITIEWTNADPVQLDGPFAGGALARSPTSPAAPMFVTKTGEDPLTSSRLVRLAPDGRIEIGAQLGTQATSVFSTLAVDDYDADGTDEALLANTGVFDATPTAYDFFRKTVEWTPAQFEPALQLVSGNVYGDSRDELVWLGENGVISVLDVATRQVLWRSDPLPAPRGLLLTDRDNNGESEIIVFTSSSVYVYMRAVAPELLQRHASFSFTGTVADVAAGDTDGDGRGETFVLVNPPNDPFGAVSPSLLAPFDSELRALETIALPWRALTIAIEPSAFARKNLLVGRAEGQLPGGRLATIDPRNGVVVGESPRLLGVIARDSVHYVDVGSGGTRASIGTDAGMYLTR